MKQKLFTAVAALFAAVSSQAACQLNLTSTQPGTDGNFVVSWNVIPGSDFIYRFEESSDRFTTVRSSQLSSGPSATTINTGTITHHTTTNKQYQYRVTTIDRLGDPNFVPCVATVNVAVPGDPAFRRLVARGVVPVVGSTVGANGALFKTSLHLEPSGVPVSGRIIFHPAGRLASDSDPSLPYHFTDGFQSLDYDDVVAAMGQSGIGSLDLVPDDGSIPLIPMAQVRLYNAGPNGTFGTFTREVLVADFYDQQFDGFTIPSTTRFRANIGFRAMTDVTISARLMMSDNGLRSAAQLTLPAGSLVFQNVDTFFGLKAQPGDLVAIIISNGSALSFHTFTDNTTNDPEIFLPDFFHASRAAGDFSTDR